MINRFVIMIGCLLVVLSLLLFSSQTAPAQSVDGLSLLTPDIQDLFTLQTVTIEFGGALGPVYSPAEVRISPGDSVEWLGDFAMHPLVSDDGLFQTVNAGSQFSFTFDEAGEYPYHCQIHESLGMRGSVLVGYYGYLPLITR